jgi:drug/metabolite transporter (DMT)-like permease
VVAVSPLARAIAGLAVGLAGLLLVAGADAPALDVAGIVLALAGWAVYWAATFRIILGRIRRR